MYFFPKYHRSETFRLETTAILMDLPNFSYKMMWEVNEIDEEGNFIRHINVDNIRSSELSAIRFPKRYLEIGLYQVTYMIEVSGKLY